ncbi:PREDICTED: uncharacterized protein LOC105359461 [Ceratosolen solmsi marchali]|uniref:Uncharacterized protein LOC105359461 n=1 Tax=Ceratosolen solmsi marchali TaxID=326594 RepID=A0AAJ6VLY0_9HYME|nr:PREDICTED: uncharacterized protein LOC105359461 [Ceratosolen solmsi marchali]
MVNERNDDAFQLVKYNSRRQRTKAQLHVNSKPVIVECDSVDEILDKINSALLKFKESQFHQTLINEVKKILITLNSTGNSWSELECHTTNTLLKQTAYYIYKLKPYVTEIVLRNNFEYTNIFNGTSLHIFLKDKLGKIPVDFWDKTTSLLCGDNDPEFIDSPYNFQEEK